MKLCLERFGVYFGVVGFGFGAVRFVGFAALIVVVSSDFVIASGSVAVAELGTVNGGMCIRALLH